MSKATPWVEALDPKTGFYLECCPRDPCKMRDGGRVCPIYQTRGHSSHLLSLNPMDPKPCLWSEFTKAGYMVEGHQVRPRLASETSRKLLGLPSLQLADRASRGRTKPRHTVKGPSSLLRCWQGLKPDREHVGFQPVAL